MTPRDPVANLAATLVDEQAALDQRFDDAGRYTRGLAPSRAPGVAVRATFSFPPADHALLAELGSRCLAAGLTPSKSELVRAGLHALTALSAPDLAAGLARLEKLKPGRAPR